MPSEHTRFPPPHLPCVIRAEMVEHVHIPDPGFARRDKRAGSKETNLCHISGQIGGRSINTIKNRKAINIRSAIHETM